ncbi:MAG: hypothetical protein ABEI78_00240, partial [Candidatus Nanohaloarchaea archaeon]
GKGNITFDTSNCNDDDKPDCQIQLITTDQAGNRNKTSLYLKIDNSKPTTEIKLPKTGSWQNNDFEIKVEDIDNVASTNELTCYYANKTSNWIKRNSCNQNFTIDISQFCSQNGQDECTIKTKVVNPVNLVATDKRKFSIDTVKPSITDKIPDEFTVINETEKIEIVFTERISSIVMAKRSNGTENTSISSSQKFEPRFSDTGKKDIIVWLEDKAGNILREKVTYKFDSSKPVLETINFSRNKDPKFNEIRIYRGQSITIISNQTDLFGIKSSKITIKKSSKNNRTLRLTEGSNKDGKWKTTLTKFSTGIYNVTDIFIDDQVGHQRHITNPAGYFKVINHSITSRIENTNSIQVGHTEKLNLTIDLNKSINNQKVEIYIPRQNQEPILVNTTSYNCTPGNCTFKYKNNELFKILPNDSQEIINIRTNITTKIVNQNTYVTWKSTVEGNNQTDSILIETPKLNITNITCSTQNCIFNQSEEFNITFDLENIQYAEHTGIANNTKLKLENKKLNIVRTKSTGNFSSGEKKELKITDINITEAGNF